MTPKMLVKKYHDEICDENGKISIFKEKTKELHRKMFDEMFSKFQIDGLIIRVGETHLFDIPFHVGALINICMNIFSKCRK